VPGSSSPPGKEAARGLKEIEMKLRTALTLAALATVLSLPLAANAAGRGNDHGQPQGRQSGQNDRSQQRSNDNNSRSDQGRGQSPSQQRPSDNGRSDQGRGQQRPADNRGNDGQFGTQPVRNDPPKIVDRRPDNDWNRGGSQPYRFVRSDHDDWQDILYTDGLFADFNLLLNDDTVCFDGSVGAFYPIWEYNQDFNSGDAACRARAELFGHVFFYRDGVRYARRIVMHNGIQCYQFARA